MVEEERPMQMPSGGTLILAGALGLAFLLLIIGRMIGMIDATDNDAIDGDVKASWWLIEIGVWIASLGLAAAGLMTRGFPAGARAAMVLVAVVLLASPSTAATLSGIFGGFGF